MPCERGYFNPTHNTNNQSACLPCDGDVIAPLIIGAGAAGVAAALGWLLVRLKPHRRLSALARITARLRRLYEQLSLRVSKTATKFALWYRRPSSTCAIGRRERQSAR